METGYRITRPEKQQLNEIFVACGLRRKDFDMDLTARNFQLKCKHDYFSFVVERLDGNKFLLRYNKVHTPKLRDLSKTWEETLTTFGSWCKEVQAELDTITGWEDFQNVNFFSEEDRDRDKPISQEEGKVIRNGLIYLGSEIQDIKEISIDQQKIINEKLDLLSKQIDNLSRFDWWSFFIGTIQNMISSAIIPQDCASKVWQFIEKAFNSNQLPQ